MTGQGVLGFTNPDSELEYTRLVEKLQSAARKHFKPEFLNRLDEIIVFRELVKQDLQEIIDLEVKKIAQRLENRECTIEYNQEVKDYLIDKGFSPEYGARPLRRAVERHLEDPLAEEILKGKITNMQHITVKKGKENLLFSIRKIRKSAKKKKWNTPRLAF